MVMVTRIRGFTIVELLVVIVVITILASITLVSYTGMQQKAKTNSGATLAQDVASKLQVFRTTNGFWPTYCQFTTNTTDGHGPIPCTTGSISAGDDAKLDDPSVLVYSSSATGTGYSAAQANGNNAIGYYLCDATTGVDLFYVDYTNNSTLITQKVGTGC